MRQSHRRVTSVPLPGSFQLTASLGALVQTFLLMRMAEVVVVEETTFRCGHGTHRHWLADWLTDCRLSGYLSADQGQTVPRPLSPTLVVHFSLVHRLLRHLSLFLIFFYFLWKRVEERESTCRLTLILSSTCLLVRIQRQQPKKMRRDTCLCFCHLSCLATAIWVLGQLFFSSSLPATVAN